ncbi:hypothetical protein BC829DRAFT_151740 [Chytridium lagenaria]|nr:hypothetical protein BC829DRAFT_151740 [Chytridium lagenaria]
MILAKSKENEVLAKTSDSIKEKSVIALSAVDSVGSFVNIDEADIYEIDTKDTDVKDEDVICEDDGPDFIDLTTVEWDYNMTPLHFAILYGNEEICRLLITAGANPRKRIKLEAGRGYYSPASFISNLRLASLCADREKSEKLLTILFSHRLSLTQTISFGNVSDQSLLHLAMYDNERVPGLGLELLETYHRLASPSDWVAAVNYISSAFESPLMLAAKNGYVSTVKFCWSMELSRTFHQGNAKRRFLDFRKTINAPMPLTTLSRTHRPRWRMLWLRLPSLALRAGNHECLKLLVEHGADLKERKDLLNDVLTVTISNQINSVEYCKKSALNSSEMVVQKPVYEGWRAFVAKIAEDSLQVAKESDASETSKRH